ncbi:MAG: YicC family protein [Spirochaetales bacterium]|nr:YicC family protein [Candidatus Physcosoma equi]
MKSMTGYGHSIYRCPEYTMELEIKSYNNRYLEISHAINPLLSSYENYIDERIKKICARGHLDLSLRLKTLKSNAKVSLDEGILSGYVEAFKRIAEITGAKEPTVFDYAQMEGVIAQDKTQDADFYQTGVDAVLEEALSMLEASKLRDGDGVKEDLLKLGAKFQESLDTVLASASELEAYFKHVLLDKYEELLGEKGKDDPRFLAEVAALLVKYSINEESSRLKVHMAEYNRLLNADGPVGKQLDFLCQEMNREVNTTASKSQLVDINLQVVKMKDALEDIREQIRNIE